MDYSCPVWRSATRCRIRKLQVLRSKCLHIATNATGYTGNKLIHNDFGVPFFTDYIRSLTERFDSKLTNVGNPLVMQLCRCLRRSSTDHGLLRQGDWERIVLATCSRQPCQLMCVCMYEDFHLSYYTTF